MDRGIGDIRKSRNGSGSTFEAAANGNEWQTEYEGMKAFDPNQPSNPPHLSEPHMAMDDDYGNIYIADKNGHGIRRLSPDGYITTVAGRVVGTQEPLVNDGDGVAVERLVPFPNGLYVLPDGVIYLLEQGTAGIPPRIRKVGKDGQLTTIITQENGVSGTFMRGLWVSRDESLIYFCALENGAGVVKKWTRENGLSTFATMPAGSEPGNLDVDAEGYVYQADRGLHRVYRIHPETGLYEAVAGNGSTSGGGDGQLATATLLPQK